MRTKCPNAPETRARRSPAPGRFVTSALLLSIATTSAALANDIEDTRSATAELGEHALVLAEMNAVRSVVGQPPLEAIPAAADRVAALQVASHRLATAEERLEAAIAADTKGAKSEWADAVEHLSHLLKKDDRIGLLGALDHSFGKTASAVVTDLVRHRGPIEKGDPTSIRALFDSLESRFPHWKKDLRKLGKHYDEILRLATADCDGDRPSGCDRTRAFDLNDAAERLTKYAEASKKIESEYGADIAKAIFEFVSRHPTGLLQDVSGGTAMLTALADERVAVLQMAAKQLEARAAPAR